MFRLFCQQQNKKTEAPGPVILFVFSRAGAYIVGVIIRHLCLFPRRTCGTAQEANNMTDIAKVIQDRLNGQANPQKARWLENYVKHNIKSKGVGIPAIRAIVKEVNREYGLSSAPYQQQSNVLNRLMNSPFTEDKLAAVLYLQLFWKNTKPRAILDITAGWFDRQWISDWNVCDWLCVRLLTPLVDAFPEAALKEFAEWNNSTGQWKARASLVPFAQCKSLPEHKKTVEFFSATLIKREERFCKTAVGWVLREFSKLDIGFVQEFLARHREWVTAEVRRNALKYIKDAAI